MKQFLPVNVRCALKCIIRGAIVDANSTRRQQFIISFKSFNSILPAWATETSVWSNLNGWILRKEIVD